ncbi:MAG: class I SAM-dependent methyltransferase [Candidatus Hydrogenedentes bacterium]|nr:class I SAM-dependent methyltransferase [Candidatus Hydrogenedentota bacterium]
MPENPHDFSGNIERFSGFAGIYDKYRPEPPSVIGSLLTRLAQATFPELVVDLGSGTGLSTRYWADKARAVIGVEPTADMRREAESQTSATNVTYRDGFSHQTGLPDRCADIVTCSQSLHWMEPQTTFQEAQRILRPGGVFAAFDYDWPPTTDSWEANDAYTHCIKRVYDFERSARPAKALKEWDKSQHVTRMKASGCFRYVTEVVAHHNDRGNAERLVGILLSQGGVMTLLKNGVTEEQVGIDVFRSAVHRFLGSELKPWHWSSRIRFGIV